MSIQISIGSFPISRVIKPKLFCLWFFRRSDRILKWNLRDRHALGFSCVRLSLDTKYTLGVASGLSRKKCNRACALQPGSPIFASFCAILLHHKWADDFGV